MYGVFLDRTLYAILFTVAVPIVLPKSPPVCKQDETSEKTA